MKRFLCVLTLLALCGCAQHPKKSAITAPLPVTKATEQKLPKIPPAALPANWKAHGRIAAANGDKGGNAQFVWTQKGDSYQIKLFGPFGSGSVYITGHPTFVELKETNGKTTRAKDAETLLKKLAGWQVPITGLRYWMRGTPTPVAKAQSEKRNGAGQLEKLIQQGWHIEYENFADNNLPQKLRLQNGKVKVKMIVTEWEAI